MSGTTAGKRPTAPFEAGCHDELKVRARERRSALGRLNGYYSWRRVALIAKETVGLLLFFDHFLEQEPYVKKPQDNYQTDTTTKNTECI
jgi:hypothetical protein